MEKTMVQSRKNYWSLDVAKFICAVLIISAHFAAEWGKFPTIIDYGFSLYVIAVPFFFCCSGFLFFKKWLPMDKENRRKYLISYQKRIWIMYGCWTAVYLPFIIISWIRSGSSAFKRILQWLHTSLVSQTYSTIWFLPALAVGIAVTCLLISRFSKKTVITVVVLLYVFCMLGYTYNFSINGTIFGSVIDLYRLIFKTTRNGIFNAVPFAFIGYLVAQNDIVPNHKKFLKNAILSLLMLLLIIIEAFFLKIKFSVTGMDVGIFLVPFTYFFIKALLNIKLKENRFWIWCRKLSLLMFVSQRLFLSALPSILPLFFSVLYSNSYIGLVVVLGLTIGFSVLFIKLNEKIKFLKYFM